MTRGSQIPRMTEVDVMMANAPITVPQPLHAQEQTARMFDMLFDQCRRSRDRQSAAAAQGKEVTPKPVKTATTRSRRIYFSISEAAEALGWSYHRVYMAVQRGHLRLARPDNKRPLLRRDIEKWAGVEILDGVSQKNE